MSTVVSSGAWREARTLISGQRGTLTAALVLLLMNRLAAVILPAASKYLIDEVLGRSRADHLAGVGLLASAAVVIESATAFGTIGLAALAGQRAVSQLRLQLQVRLMGQPLSRTDNMRTGSLAARVITDTEQVRFLVGNGVVQLTASLLTAALALALLLWLNPVLTLAVLGILALLGLDLVRAFRRLSAAFAKVSLGQADLAGRLSQVLGGMRLVKACAAERSEQHRFARESHALVRESMRGWRAVARLGASSTLASGAISVLLLFAGGHAVAFGTMTLGSLVMFTWLAGLLLAPMVNFVAGGSELGKVLGALERIAQLRALATEEEEDVAQARGRLARVAGRVEAENVSFGYSPQRLVLCGVSLCVPAGTTTALVGPSGSGKSTLCRLVLGFDHPHQGRLLVDGCDLTTVRRRSYRAHLGTVLQDDVLFDATIADNIRLGRPRASWHDVVAAAKAAHCDEFIERLPDGYHTRVGERGLILSCGQRQRVAIARALLNDPRILVLDEATSSLDADNEALVEAALERLRRDRTTFVVTHRLATIRGADQIVVLDAGKVVEHGTHEELVSREGCYWRLCRGQHPRGDSLLRPEPSRDM